MKEIRKKSDIIAALSEEHYLKKEDPCPGTHCSNCALMNQGKHTICTASNTKLLEAVKKVKNYNHFKTVESAQKLINKLQDQIDKGIQP